MKIIAAGPEPDCCAPMGSHLVERLLAQPGRYPGLPMTRTNGQDIDLGGRFVLVHHEGDVADDLTVVVFGNKGEPTCCWLVDALQVGPVILGPVSVLSREDHVTDGWAQRSLPEGLEYIDGQSK